MEWKTIDSAPRDGTKILVRDRFSAQVCQFTKEGVLELTWNGERFSCDNNVDCDATHWMQLPEPPAT